MKSFLRAVAWAALSLVGLSAVAAPPVAPATNTPVAPTDVILLDFSASWCGPCRSMAPLVDEVAAAGWIVRHVDVDREGDLVRRFGVTGVPFFIFNQRLAVSGAQPAQVLLEAMEESSLAETEE